MFDYIQFIITSLQDDREGRHRAMFDGYHDDSESEYSKNNANALAERGQQPEPALVRFLNSMKYSVMDKTEGDQFTFLHSVEVHISKREWFLLLFFIYVR